MSNEKEGKRRVGRPTTYEVEMKKWTLYTYMELYKAVKTLCTLYPEKYQPNSVVNRMLIQFFNELPAEEKEKIEHLYPIFFGDSIDEIERRLSSKE